MAPIDARLFDQPHRVVRAHERAVGTVHAEVNPVVVIACADDIDITPRERHAEGLRLRVPAVPAEADALDVRAHLGHLQCLHLVGLFPAAGHRRASVPPNKLGGTMAGRYRIPLSRSRRSTWTSIAANPSFAAA